jgi:7,8-dihydropterin-6-yl-methyl-4-(beta-D-ribofuranosyl)aminobenzene 5'-phosphate synthase
MENTVLKEASRIEIISLMDNTIDFLSSNDKREVQPLRQWTERHGEAWSQTHIDLPFAEHGFSMLIKVFKKGEKSRSVLFDTGISSSGVIVNAKRMGIELREIEYVVLSHGHYDHFGGLTEVIAAINKTDLPVITHIDMFKPRGTSNPKGAVKEHPKFPTAKQLSQAKIINTKQPYLIADGSVCVTGEIPRETSFESGYGQNRILGKGIWHPDPWILDDRALVLKLKDKGLVVISGCAHAGIINTVLYAQQIAGGAKVHAVIGGFHLAGKEYENRIDQTVKELKRITPKLLVPCHCTGWHANFALAKEFPDAYVHNSVGNFYQL